jgi:hypothetical protein
MQAEDPSRQPAATGRGRRRAVGALAGLALVAGGWGAGWYHVAGVFRDGIERWAETRRAAGLSVGWTAVEMGGFPLRWMARLNAPALTRIRPAPGWFWRGETVTLSWRPWAPRTVSFAAPGAHRVGADASRPETALAVSAASATGQIETGDDGALRLLAVAIGGATVTPAGAQPMHVARLDATLSAFPPGPPAIPGDAARDAPPSHETAGRLDATVTGLTLPADERPALGHSIARVALTAVLVERLPTAPLREALAAWAAKGGTVEIEGLAVDWGKLAVRGDGTLALDAALQPVASSSVRISGYNETVDALAAAGAIRPRAAFMAKVVLGAMGTTPVDGGPAEIQVPLTVQDGRLFVGPVVLLQLPRIAWPGR